MTIAAEVFDGRINVYRWDVNTLTWVVWDGALTTVNATQTSVADSASSVTILAANEDRTAATVFNDSTVTLYLRFSTSAASVTNYTVQVSAGAYYEVPTRYSGAITGIWASDPGTGAARVTEII